MDEHAMSWCRDFRILGGEGQVLEEIQNFNLISVLLNKATANDAFKDSIGAMLVGQGNKAKRNASMSHPRGQMYNCGLCASGILGGSSSNPILPMAFSSAPLQIEFTLAPIDECFVYTKDTSANAPSPSYTIDMVQYHASCLSMSAEYNQRFSEQLTRNGIDMSFSTYKHHSSVITSDQMSLSISQNASSVKASYHLLRSKAKVSSPEHDSLSTYKSGGLKSFQVDLGGKLYPEQPIKLDQSGVVDLYSHNLMSWNMYRNNSLSSSIVDSNFTSTEATSQPLGNISTGYKSLPIRRVYGTWLANGKEIYGNAITKTTLASAGAPTAGESATIANLVNDSVVELTLSAGKKNPLTGQAMANANTVAITHTVPTLTFVPDDPRDIGLIEQGLRCKIGVSALLAPEDEETADANTDILGTKDGYTNLHDTDLGLDRFFASGPANAYEDGAGNELATNVSLNNQFNMEGKNVMYAGSASAVSWGHTASGAGGVGEMAQRHVAGVGIGFVDGQNRPILSKKACAGFAGFVDCMPSDESFYISNNLETFQESPLISGSDLSSAVPLFLKLEYETNQGSGAESFYEKRDQSDSFQSYIMVDSVLRLMANGQFISSV